MPSKASARRARQEPNRLHCTTERWEDVLALLLGVLLVAAGVLGFVTGGSVHDAVAERARSELADRTSMAGVVLEDTVPITAANRSGSPSASVRWIGDDGLERTGTATVPGIHHTGDTVTLWEDRAGHLASAPATATDATAAGVHVGLLTAIFGALVVYLTGWALFTWTARRFARAWEQEWERVGPEWTGRTRF